MPTGNTAATAGNKKAKRRLLHHAHRQQHDMHRRQQRAYRQQQATNRRQQNHRGNSMTDSDTSRQECDGKEVFGCKHRQHQEHTESLKWDLCSVPVAAAAASATTTVAAAATGTSRLQYHVYMHQRSPSRKQHARRQQHAGSSGMQASAGNEQAEAACTPCTRSTRWNL